MEATFSGENSQDRETADFDAVMSRLVQELKNVRSAAGRIVRARDAQEMVVLRARVPALQETLSSTLTAVTDATRTLEATPFGGTLPEGYAGLLEDEFRRAGVAFEGEFPEYEAFPLTIRVNAQTETVRIGRKTVQALEPRTVARAVQAELRRLQRSSFSADRFLGSLAYCYDILARDTAGTAIPLIDIYRLLSVRTGAAGYTRQEFAFDIYRLRHQSDLTLDDKSNPDDKEARRKVEFVHGKQGTKIVIPRAQGGVEVFTGIAIGPVFSYA